MDVSIIIVNYNTSALVCAAVESVHRLTAGVEYEIIVVDNLSEDGGEISRRFGERIKYVPLPENIGFGRANNAGLEHATGRHIFFLNPDTLLCNNAVRILSDYMDSHPECGVCGGNLFDGDGRPMHSFLRVLPGMATEINGWLLGIPFWLRWGRGRFFNPGNRPMQVGYITGADMMVRRSVLERVGGFDPDFFMYFEETELTHRIRRAGYEIVSVPQAEITHLEGRSFSSQSRRKEMYKRSKQIYLVKVYGTAQARRVERVYRLAVGIKSVVLFWKRRV